MSSASSPAKARVPEDPLDHFVRRLSELLGPVWARRRFVRNWAIAGFTAGVIIALLVPGDYQSTARLMPPDRDSSLAVSALARLGSQSPADLMGSVGDIVGAKSSGAAYIAILRSRTVQDAVIDKLGLRSVTFGIGRIALHSTRTYISARRKLDRDIDIQEDKRGGFIYFVATAQSPEQAKAITSAYVDELNKRIADLSTSAARREREFLEARLQQVAEERRSAAERLSQYSSEHGTIDLNQEGKIMVEAAARLQGELIAAQAALEGLQRIYADENVRVRAAKAHVNELQRALDRMTGTSAGVQGSSLQVAGNHDVAPSLRKLPIVGVRYTELYTDAMVKQAVFETLTKQYELARLEEARVTPVLKLLDAPDLPEKRSGPSRTAIALGVTTLCLAFCLAVIYAKEYWSSIGDEHALKSLVASARMQRRV